MFKALRWAGMALGLSTVLSFGAPSDVPYLSPEEIKLSGENAKREDSTSFGNPSYNYAGVVRMTIDNSSKTQKEVDAKLKKGIPNSDYGTMTRGKEIIAFGGSNGSVADYRAAYRERSTPSGSLLGFIKGEEDAGVLDIMEAYAQRRGCQMQKPSEDAERNRREGWASFPEGERVRKLFPEYNGYGTRVSVLRADMDGDGKPEYVALDGLRNTKISFFDSNLGLIQREEVNGINRVSWYFKDKGREFVFKTDPEKGVVQETIFTLSEGRITRRDGKYAFVDSSERMTDKSEVLDSVIAERKKLRARLFSHLEKEILKSRKLTSGALMIHEMDLDGDNQNDYVIIHERDRGASFYFITLEDDKLVTIEASQ